MRHAESAYNPGRKINCDKNVKIHLTMHGREQAEKIGKKFGKIQFDIIFVSEFIRTKETAEIINKHLKTVIGIDKRLNEIDLGFEGKHADEFWKAARKSGDILNFKLKGKESFLDVKKRVKEFLQGLKKENYERVLAVTHEANVMSARTIFRELTDEEAFTTPIKNCEIKMFEL